MANVITTLLKMDSTQFKTGMKAAQQSIRETDGVVNKAKAGWAGAWDSFKSSPAAIAGTTAAIGGLAVAANSAINEASDLEESINAVKVTFGSASQEILDFGEDAAKSAGLAKSEFNQLATPLGSILKNSGLAIDAVADKTITLTQRAADMASVFNTDVSEALQAIQAGLRGEQDPLEKYGVSLSAAKVEARALADTGKDTAKALTDQEKALARINIILDQTSQTQGDFANTSDGLANSQRILRAEWKNLQADIGRDLAPALTGLVQNMQSLIEVSEKLHLDDVFKIPGLADNVGTTIGNFLGDLAFGPDGRRANEAIADAFAASTQAAADFDRTLLNGLTTFDQVRAKVLEVTGDITAANMVSLEWKKGSDDAARSVADLGDKAANAGLKIGDMAGALADARDKVIDLGDKAANAGLKIGDMAGALDSVKETLAGLGDELEGELGQLDLFDDIQDQLDGIEKAAKDAASGGAKETRDYNREVRRLQGQLIDFLATLEDIPAQKRMEILAQIRTGDVETLKRVLDELTQDRWINIGVRPNPQQAFSSVNGSFGPGFASGPTFNGSNPAPAPASSGGYVDNRNITIINPVGSTPTTQYIDGQTDFRRNGAR